MRIAITGGTGFVGRNLARRLVADGHSVVLISRGIDARDPLIRDETGVEFRAIGLSSVSELADGFRGCDAVAHLAGINRELGDQTFAKVHAVGTESVVRTCQAAGIPKIILLSFLRARPACGSGYHESKWMAEEIIRSSGLDFTIFKAGVIYGKGDHMLDHISHALHTFPIFLTVGFKPKAVRPLAVEDLVEIMVAALVDGRLSNQTLPVTGPEELNLKQVATRIMEAAGRRRLIMPAPVWVHKAMAWVFERTMTIPLAAQAQVRILSESLAEPLEAPDSLPEDLKPSTPFTLDQIRKGLPEARGFGWHDCLCRQRRAA